MFIRWNAIPYLNEEETFNRQSHRCCSFLVTFIFASAAPEMICRALACSAVTSASCRLSYWTCSKVSVDQTRIVWSLDALINFDWFRLSALSIHKPWTVASCWQVVSKHRFSRISQIYNRHSMQSVLSFSSLWITNVDCSRESSSKEQSVRVS